MFRAIIPAAAIIAVITLASIAIGDSPSVITFLEKDGRMVLSNQKVSIIWQDSTLPDMAISSDSLGFSFGNLGVLELRDTGGEYSFIGNGVVANTRTTGTQKWDHSSSKIQSDAGFQVDHSSSLPIAPTLTKSVFVSISSTISNGDVSLNGQKVHGDEVLVTVTISNWPWTNYDNVLATRLTIGADLMPDCGTGPISASGDGIKALSPYSTGGALVVDGRSHGRLNWSHEAESISSGTAMRTLVRVYAGTSVSGTDVIFVYSGAYGADRVTQSFIFQAPGGEAASTAYPGYTVPVVSGVVLVLALAVVMFRRRVA